MKDPASVNDYGTNTLLPDGTTLEVTTAHHGRMSPALSRSRLLDAALTPS